MKISELIEKLQKIQDKHGDIPIAGRYINGMRYAYEDADKVRLKLIRPKTDPKVYVETWFE